MSSASILGIDFGTTNTSAAFFDATGKLRLVPASEKSFVLPSVAWFHAADKAIVGQAARTQIIDDPEHTIFGAKRFLGRRFQSPYVALHKGRFAFPLVEGPDGYTAVEIYGQVTPLTDVVHRIIQQIVALANHAAGAPFKECVLTVPAHASIRQREAVRFAAEKTGLKVRAIINEPTAAALYYANLRNPEQTVLVFDLGGGTFDATVMSVQNRTVRVLATGGDSFLGGADFDEAIVERLVDAFEAEHRISLRSNQVVMQRLIFAAEAAKVELSRAEKAHLSVPCVAQRGSGFLNFDYEITREQLEDWVKPLIERTAAACDDVLARSGLWVDKIDELVLVGGQTRMPAIRRRFAHFKRFSEEKDVNPELGVAVGAAMLGRNLARGASGLNDVVPIPLSAVIPGGRAIEVISANTPVPCTRALPLGNLPPWTAPIPIAILETLGRTSIEREMLGTVAVPPEWRMAQQGKKGTPALELNMTQDFVLSAWLVSATGQKTPVKIIDPRLPARI